MTEKELMQKNIEEFSRLQTYMLLAEKDSETYKAMKVRYIELKNYTYIIWYQSNRNRQDKRVIYNSIKKDVKSY